MNFDPDELKGFWLGVGGDTCFTVANWREAQRYGLSRYCMNCGAVFRGSDEQNGLCPCCDSDYIVKLRTQWGDFDDAWAEDPEPEEVEAARIYNRI